MLLMAKKCLLSAVILVSILTYISYLLEIEKAPALTSFSPIKKVIHAPWSQSVWEMKNVTALNEDRLRNIHNFCNKSGNSKMWEVKATDKRLNDHFLVDEKHKMVYCYIEKVASTNWRRAFLVFAGLNEKMINEAHVDHVD